MSKWVIAPFHSPPSPPRAMISSSTIRQHKFWFRREKKTGLEDVERDAAIRVTSKPKARHASITARPIRNMHVNTYFGVFLGAKKRSKAGKERNEADKVRAMTFRRRPAQVTAAFRDELHKRQVGTKDVIGRNQPRSLALRGGERGGDFGLNVAYGLQEGPTLSCQGLVSCHPLRQRALQVIGSAPGWPK
jgi:hypothetical protein